jgi:hypothetical protein
VAERPSHKALRHHKCMRDRLPEVCALQLAEALAVHLDECRWAGADPYDGLASPLATHLWPGPWRLRQVFVQCVRRSPVNLRGLLRIDPRQMAAATGLAATASARLAADPVWQARRDWLARRTAERQIEHGCSTGLWGYEFDVQTRWGFYAAGSPNIVATSFAAHGCLEGGALDDERATWLGRALLDQLWRGQYFAYTPTTSVLIHNANLLGAALAARLAELTGLAAELRHELRDAAAFAVATAARFQRPDGSWPYGQGRGLGWVDGYHTAYSLLSLDEVCARGIAEDVGRAALERGARFYFAQLFDGTRPVYFAGRHNGPSDVNNVATGLRAAVWGARRGSVPPAFPAGVLRFLYDQFWHNGRYFKASATRWRPTARMDYPRWAGAPALDALTFLAIGSAA